MEVSSVTSLSNEAFEVTTKLTAQEQKYDYDDDGALSAAETSAMERAQAATEARSMTVEATQQEVQYSPQASAAYPTLV